ncbi:MAG TPA: C39 family peptidase [Chloroflexota bacterium]
MKIRPSRRRTLILSGSAVAGVLALTLVPVLGYVRAAGTHPPTSTARSSAKSVHQTIAKRTSVKTAPVRIAVKSAASLGPLETIIETLNNCGPASVASVLAYWHIYLSQAQVQSVVRADNSYWGMSPVDLPAYARSLGMRALVGYGGSEKLIKLLVANGFPVIASQYVSSSDLIRHYRPIEAYNDRTQTFVSADPLLGVGHVISYSEFNAIWAESDYRFQVIYPASRQALLTAILRAAGWNKTRTFTQAIRWEEQQMATSDFQSAGSWIWSNGYVDVAFDQAQMGQFRKAQSTLAQAARQGVSSVMIGWVQNDIRILERYG